MSTTEIIFAGIDILSGRKPITYAVLDQELRVVMLERCDISYVMAHLGQHKKAILGVNSQFGGKSEPSERWQKIGDNVRDEIIQAGIKPYLTSHAPKQWVETNPLECFSSLSGRVPQSRRTLVGVLQRSLILYDEGLQINDPMEFFEEITRHHLLAGLMPVELLYSASELDALAAAYIAWMLINKPVQVDLTKERGEGMILIPREDKNWWRKKPIVREPEA
ncbi:MAG TPA: hypothetical protein VJM08_14845 [Anaerolineales bacterium]|nr:hypothetical protein [Anaerolineales bacterium]